MTYNPQSTYTKLVQSKGGYVCHHAHFDKAYLISEEGLKLSVASLQEKWRLYRELKANYTEEDLYRRMASATEKMISQGVKHCRTFVDADHIVGSLPIDTALKVKADYADQINLEVAIQPLEGVLELKAQKAFYEACQKADVVGGLPDRDANPEAHIETIFSMAKELGKPVDVHVDQNNSPYERETRMVASRIGHYGLQGRVRLVHAISLSCQDEPYRKEVYELLKSTSTTVIVCPSAGISMRQKSNLYAPIHNSLAPVMELIEAGVDVALGVDNIQDLFMPLVDGDLWFESRLLMEAIRSYDLDLISDIATNRKGFYQTSQPPEVQA